MIFEGIAYGSTSKTQSDCFGERARSPEYDTIDYMTILEGFKELGELFPALHDFCKLPFSANEKHVET